MKKLILYSITITIILGSLVYTGCWNPMQRPSNQAGEEEGNVALRILIPNYDFHTDTSGGVKQIQPKVISPNSRFIKVYLNDVPVWESWLEDWQADTASNGFFYTSWEQTITVPTVTGATLKVEMLDSSSGNVLTSGTASNVTITTGTPTEVSISLTPPPGMFTALSLGTLSSGHSVNSESMVFFSFGGTSGIGYDITVTPTYGEPDFYLFDPTGKRPGLEKGFDFAYTEENGDGETGGVTTMTTYNVAADGTYYIGVYGWRNYANFNIVVSTGGAGDRPADPEEPPITQVEIYVEAAITALENRDYDEALTQFTLAYEKDKYYGPAFAGYNALYLMNMMINPDIVNLARNNLGLIDYPTTMSELFSGQWLQDFFDTSGENWLMPRFKDQDDMDGVKEGDSPDGVIDFYERMMAFARHFMTHNSDFNALSDTVLDLLGDSLDFHMQQIMSMPLDLNMRFTWDMAFDEWETEVVEYDPWDGASYNWPVDGHGNPLDITVGRADLLLLASMLEMVEFLINTAKIYNFNLLDDVGDSVLVEYWNTFNPLDGTAPGSYTSDTTPFLTDFLQPRDGWEDHIEGAEDAFLDALDYIQNAFYEIKADPDERAGYFLSSTSTLPDIADDWDYWVDVMEFTIKAIDEAVLSITDPEADYIFYFPIAAIMEEDFDYYTFGNWPDSIVIGESIGVNLGTLFLNPLSIVLELGADGEPVWYEFSADPATFSVLSTIDPSIPDPAFAFCKIPDLSLGGIIPVDNGYLIPRDDETTGISLEINFVDDVILNGWWDPGEQINWAELNVELEGVIDFYNNNIDLLYPAGDPIAYYTCDSAADIPDEVLSQYTEPANYAALRTELDSSFGEYPGRPNALFFLYNTQLYIAAPAEAAWYSFAGEGDTDTDPDGEPITGTGSIWWWLLNMMYQ